jgi:hypothetical protein
MQGDVIMRTRDKQRIFRRFMRGESVASLALDMPYRVNGEGYYYEQDVEAILREGLDGAFDLPMKQARAYAKAAGVKVGRMVKV